MTSLDNSIPDLARLLVERLTVVGALAENLETSRLAIGRNDGEAIARGAAHQPELCRQWSRLEEQLRAQAARRRIRPASETPADPSDSKRLADLSAEWDALSARIRYLTRVHRSLLRHMQRSLAIWDRVLVSCAPTYTPAADTAPPSARLNAGEESCRA